MESTGETEDRGAKEQLTMFNEWGDERGRPQMVNGEVRQSQADSQLVQINQEVSKTCEDRPSSAQWGLMVSNKMAKPGPPGPPLQNLRTVSLCLQASTVKLIEIKYFIVTDPFRILLHDILLT